MADDSSVLVELQMASDQFEATLLRVQEHFSQTVGGMGGEARDAGADVDRAFNSLGVKSIENIRYEIASLQQAFATLKSSGTVSAEDIARAESALLGKVSALNAEISKTRGVSATAGEALESAFGKTGVRSADAIEREIRSIEIALQRLGQDAKVSGADFDRAFAAGQTRIKALEVEMRGVVQTTHQASAATGGFSSSVGGVVRNMLAWASAAVGLNQAFSFGRNVLETGAAFEVLEKRLTGLLGSSTQAKQEMQNLKDLAAATPFEVMELSEAYTRLTSFGMKPTMETMRSLTDTVAALGGGSESLQRVTIALGQAWVKGKLQGEEIMQLTEAGVPVWEALARATGKSTAELNKMSQAGQLGRDVIRQLVGELGKMNVGASALQMNTFSGAVSNAKDALTDFFSRIADAGVLDYAKRQIQDLLAEFDRMKNSGELEQKARAIADGFIGMANAVKSVAGFVRDYAGAIKFALEMMVVNRLLDFTQGLAAQAAASVRAAIEARALAVAAREAGAASAAAGAASAASTGGLAAMTMGARVATGAMIALRVAMRAIGIGLLVEGVSLLVSTLSKHKSASDQARDATNDLAAASDRAKKALEQQKHAQDLLDGKVPQEVSYQSDRIKMMEAARTAASELGLEMARFGNVASDAFIKADNQLAALIRGMPMLRANGVDAASAVSAAIDKMLESAKNQTEVDSLISRLRVLGKAGDISGDQMVAGLEKAKQKTEELKKGVGLVADAYKQLGMKSPEELRKAAAESEKAYDTIRKSGTASANDLREAFMRYAKAAIDANGGVASDAIRGQAAMRGLKIEADETGKAIVKLDGSSLDRVSEKADRTASSLRGAREESDRLNTSLGNKPAPRRVGNNLSGNMADQPDNLTVEQMKDAGFSSQDIENYQLNRKPDQQVPGQVNRYSFGFNTDTEAVARANGLRGDAAKAFAEVFGAIYQDKWADMIASESAFSIGTPSGYNKAAENAFQSAVREAKSKARSMVSGSGGDKQPAQVVSMRRVVIDGPGGQKMEVNVSDEKSEQALINALRIARGASA